MSYLPEPTKEEKIFLEECLPGTDLSEFFNRICILGEFLYETNESMNLTRIPPDQFWSKHVCDSLSILKVLPELAHIRAPFALCDTGCGAGFPSLILAAALPDLPITPLDSTGKKILFVSQAAKKMKVDKVKPIHARANELARRPPYKKAFLFVTARAVADAAVLLRETFGFLQRNGKLVIYRTMSQAEPELPLLHQGGFCVTVTDEFLLPGNAGKRMFLIIENV